MNKSRVKLTGAFLMGMSVLAMYCAGTGKVGLVTFIIVGWACFLLVVGWKSSAEPSELEWSGRKQMEAALHEQRRLFDALMNTSPDAIYFKDRDSRFVRINHATAVAFGLTDPRQAIGKTDADFFAPAHADQARRDEQAILASGQPLIDHEEQEVWPDGRTGWVSTTKMPLYDAQCQICGTIGISRNITERKLAQEKLAAQAQQLLCINTELQQEMAERRLLEGQLVQAQKLEALGQLAAGVAHEINTPIQYVGDNWRFVADSFRDIDQALAHYARLQQAARSMPGLAALVTEAERLAAAVDLAYLRAEIPHALRQGHEGLERVAHIVRSMKEFSHPGSERPEAVDLNQAIESTLTVCRHEWKYVAEVETDLDPALPPVRGRAGELKQVLLNLIINAAHAIAAAGERAQPGRIRVATRCQEGFVEVRVQDNGTGIAEPIQGRVFDPFFTTKEVGKGTGQGLAIARHVIVKKHGGSLSFDTKAGAGTTFLIRLPISGKSAPEPTPEPALACA